MNLHQQQQQQQSKNMQMAGTGLTRYRSAPSSFFTSFLDDDNNNNSMNSGGFTNDDFDVLFNPRATSPETKRLFTSFMNSSGPALQENNDITVPVSTPSSQLNSHQLPPRVMKEPLADQTQFQAHQKPLKRHQRSRDYSNSSYSKVSEMMSQSSTNSNQTKMEGGGDRRGGGGGSSLLRQSSSPAGLFDNIIIGNDQYNTTRGFGNYTVTPNIGIKAESPFPSEFASRGNVENKSGDNPQFDEDGFANIDAFLKDLEEEDDMMFVPDESKNKPEGGNNSSLNQLSRHQSLPANFSATEKLLQDSVPCKLRAKRGCATHPRSIAERVRRTKISERMRKLQELVPNMEKQTNTAEMLDLAADYIKDLQRQLQMLSGNRGRCTCSAKQRYS